MNMAREGEGAFREDGEHQENNGRNRECEGKARKGIWVCFRDVNGYLEFGRTLEGVVEGRQSVKDAGCARMHREGCGKQPGRMSCLTKRSIF